MGNKGGVPVQIRAFALADGEGRVPSCLLMTMLWALSIARSSRRETNHDVCRSRDNVTTHTYDANIRQVFVLPGQALGGVDGRPAEVQEIAEDLRHRIRSGELAQGDKLPTYEDLGDTARRRGTPAGKRSSG